MRRLLLTLALLCVTAPAFAQTVNVVGVKPEDGATANGDLLFPIGVKRCDSASVSSGTDGDLTYPCVDSSGNLRTTATLTGAKSNNAATPGSDNFGSMGDVACSSAASFTAGRLVFPCTDLFGSRHVVLIKADGTAVEYVTSPTHDSAAATQGDQIMGECDDTSTDAIDEGDAGRLRMDCTNRQTYTRVLDPCSGTLKTTTPISLTADTVIIVAVTGKKNYICNLTIVAGAAEIVSITEGTGVVCATSEAALAGSTTDANGMSFAANGGLSAPGSDSTILAGKTANVDTCLNVSGSNRVSGFVTFVQQ